MPSYYSSWVANGTNVDKTAYRTRLDLTFATGTSSQNYTDVTWSLYLENNKSRFADHNTKGHVTINGVKVWDYPSTQTRSATVNNSSVLLQAQNGTNKATGVLRVPHESNGTKTLSFSTSFESVNKTNVWSARSVMTSSGSVALTTIPRYTSITAFSSSSIQRDRFTISWTAANTVNYWWYSLNDGSTWTAVGNPASTTASRTITGRSPATSYNVKVKVRRSDSNLETTSSRLVVTTEAGASPNTPTITEATRDSFKINVTANKSFNGFQYNINGGTWSAKQSGTSVTVTGRAAGTTYQVRVKVYDAINTSLLSGQSSAVNATTVAAASPNTPTLASRTAIEVVFNWSSNRTVTNVQYKLWSSDSWRSAGADFSARTSGSVTVKSLSPATGYSISVQVKDAVKGTWSGASGALSATTYALSTVKGADFNLGSNVTATVTEAHTSMYHDIALEANYGGSWQQVASVTNQNKDASLTIPAATITAIENGTPNSKTVSMRLKVTTKWGSGGTVQGSAQTSPTFTATIINANPTLSGITYKDVHNDPAFITWKGGDQKILRNVSIVEAKLGTATAIKGATLSKYVFKLNNQSLTVNATSGAKTQTGAIANLGVVDSATNQNIEVTVYDSRGNSTPMSVPVSILDYIAPQVLEIEAQRQNNYEPPTTLVVSGRSYIVKPTAASANVNTYTAKYRIKKAGTSTWSGYTNVTTTKGTESGNWQNYSVNHDMGPFDSDTSYDIQFVFKDSLGIEHTRNAVLTKGIGLMTFLQDKVEVGVPLYDKNSAKKYVLEGDAAFFPVGSIYLSVVSTNPSTYFGGTWVSFGAGRMLVGVDPNDTAYNTVEKTGGSKTNTLAVANLPAHNHTATTASAGAHTHTTSGTAASAGAHSHTITASSASAGGHSHTITSSSNSTGAHTHNQNSLTLFNDQSAYDFRIATSSGGYYAGAGRSTYKTASAGGHSHTITSSSNSTGSHSHTITASSNSTGAHTHNTSGTAASAGAHSHTVTVANTGSGTAFNTVDPYITVYMWKRTA